MVSAAPVAYLREVVGPAPRYGRQWATVCPLPGCDGRTISIDLTAELAGFELRAHQLAHASGADE